MNIKNKILYGIAYGFWFVLSLLPFRILFLLSDCLYFLVSKVVKYRHKVIWKNLKESFPDKTEAELRTIEKGFYHWFCDYIVETDDDVAQYTAQANEVHGYGEIQRSAGQWRFVCRVLGALL